MPNDITATPTAWRIPFDPAPFLRADAEAQAKREAAVEERRRQDAAQQASAIAAALRTVEAFQRRQQQQEGVPAIVPAT